MCDLPAETLWLMSLTTKSSDGSRNTRSQHTKTFVDAAFRDRGATHRTRVLTLLTDEFTANSESHFQLVTHIDDQ